MSRRDSIQSRMHRLVVIFCMFQKYFVKGIMIGAVKG